MRTTELGTSAMYRILKNAGAERVSSESANELRIMLEGIANNIAHCAVDMAKHAGRKTIKSEDIALASRSFKPLI